MNTPAENAADTRSLVKVFMTFAVAGLIGFLLAMVAQPQRLDLVLAGTLLMMVGLGVARYALEIIMLPLMVVVWLWNRLRRAQPAVRNGASWDEKLAGFIFVLAYALMSAIGGGVICVFAGGWGVFAGVSAFGVAGLVWGIVVRRVAVDELSTVEPQVATPAAYNRDDQPPQIVKDLAHRVAEEFRQK